MKADNCCELVWHSELVRISKVGAGISGQSSVYALGICSFLLERKMDFKCLVSNCSQ